MKADTLLKSILAGLSGTAAHLLLMFAKNALGLLPQFQPYAEFQRGLTMLTGATVSAPVAYALSLLNGAVVMGFVFGRLFRRLPGDTSLRKGLFFAGCAWLVAGLVFFPIMDRGLFASRLGLGFQPALLMLVMLSVYSCAMSFAYQALAASGGRPPLTPAPPPAQLSDQNGRQ